jgi:hypothetical protein
VLIVAAVTTGKALPEFGIPARAPQHVLLVITEDDWSTDVRPRLELAGADLHYISVLCDRQDGSGAPVFPFHMPLVYDADPTPVLVVVDAWLDTVDRTLSVRDPQQARRALHPWTDLAIKTDAAVILVTHTNRIASGNVRDLYGATGALRQKARMTLFAQRDDDGNLLVGPDKANATATDIAATKFRIEGVRVFDPTDDSDGTVPILRYVGQSTKTAGQHVSDTYDAERGEDDQDRADAETWLRMVLESKPGELSSEIKAKAKAAGIPERTLQRARKNLRVEVTYEKQSVGGPVSRWALPANGDESEDDDPDTDAGDDDDPRAALPVSDGIRDTGGINNGHAPMRPCASSDKWHKLAQGTDRQKRPLVPLTDTQTPPSGITTSTPGVTDRVLKAVANASKPVVGNPNGHITTNGQPVDNGPGVSHDEAIAVVEAVLGGRVVEEEAG